MSENKTLVMIFVGIVGVLVVAALIWPISEERNRAIDERIINDFEEMSFLVEDAFSAEGRIPDSIDDLDLPEELRDRASDHNYTIERDSARSYKLCADFKTDTTDNGSGSSDLYGFGSFGRTHKAGNDCIDYEVYSFGSSSNFNSGFTEPSFEGFGDFEFSEDDFEGFDFSEDDFLNSIESLDIPQEAL